jgi:hypothetical protein
MPSAKLQEAHDFISHLESVAPNPGGDLLHARFAGFAAVSMVSSLEQVVKEEFVCFANTRHADFEAFVVDVYDSFNAQLKMDLLISRHLKRFGQSRVLRFRTLVERCERRYLRWMRRSLKSDYANLIQWRHDCAHEGYLKNATLHDVKVAAKSARIVAAALVLALAK